MLFYDLAFLSSPASCFLHMQHNETVLIKDFTRRDERKISIFNVEFMKKKFKGNANMIMRRQSRKLSAAGARITLGNLLRKPFPISLFKQEAILFMGSTSQRLFSALLNTCSSNSFLSRRDKCLTSLEIWH
jgi:hypothetical protein